MPPYKYNPSNIFGYSAATKTGKAPYKPSGSSTTYETAYWIWGDLSSTTPPLIVLHGGPAAPGRDWQVISLLHNQYSIPVILYDQIGCGESTRLPELKGDTTFWTTELFLNELQNLINHLNISKFHLLGHSCGAMIAIPYALTQPQGLQKLIIASSSASEKLRAFGFKNRYKEMPDDVHRTLLKHEDEGTTNSPEYGKAYEVLMKHTFVRRDPVPEEINETMANMQEDDTVQSTLYGGKPLEPTGPWSKYDVIDRLQEITETTVPGGVLLTNGKYDVSSDEGMMPFFYNIRARVKWMSFAQSAHFPHLDEPEGYLRAVGEFLKST